MGASITVGSGIAHSGDPRDVVCTIGDSTFLHTGIQGLMNAVYNGANMTVVILDNRITAMTGHQPNPNTGVTATGAETPPISLDAICRSCGVTFVETVDPYDLTGMLRVLEEAKKKKGVRVDHRKADVRNRCPPRRSKAGPLRGKPGILYRLWYVCKIRVSRDRVRGREGPDKRSVQRVCGLRPSLSGGAISREAKK